MTFVFHSNQLIKVLPPELVVIIYRHQFKMPGCLTKSYKNSGCQTKEIGFKCLGVVDINIWHGLVGSIQTILTKSHQFIFIG